MTAKYFAILTNQGAARLANAAALGTKLNLTQMAVGDANGTLPTPDPAQTKLINQKRIAPLNLLTVDPANTSQIIAEQIIPENEGGFWIREIGLYDDDGILIAVANCPETYKPQLQEGSGRTQTIRMILIVSSTSAITLKIDPAVVLATRQYVDDKIIEVKGYADDLMKKHVEAANPHKQYPLIANALKEMVDAGLAGDVLKNLGLGEAARRNVGTGENQIPDMASFSGVRDYYGKQLLPGGLILQWLTIPSSAAANAVTLNNGNYQLSGYKWPQSFGVLFAVFATKVSGSTNEAYAISVNRHSTDVIVTWNARKADDVHILGIGKL
ncbi:phage tail protein [Escherichia coli]